MKIYILIIMSLVHAITELDETQDIEIYPIQVNIERAYRPLLNNGKYIEDLALLEDEHGNVVNSYQEGVNRWELPHSKKFLELTQMNFGTAQFRPDKDEFLQMIKAGNVTGTFSEPFPYQKMIYDYMRLGTPYRGLLLEHGLGSGKSRSAIMVAESFRQQGLHVLVLTPAFLKLNFMGEIHKWGNEDIRMSRDIQPSERRAKQSIIDQYYHFVHYNATGTGPDKPNGGKGGVYESLAKLGIGFPHNSVNGKRFPYINKKYGKDLQPPRNMLIIIEEAHGLNRSFISGGSSSMEGRSSKVKAYLYPLLMQAKDCKVLALSATPMISNPFEMAPLYNILRGPIRGKGTAFPLDEAKFNDLFIDYEAKTFNTESTDAFMRRIIGLTSYFEGIKTSDDDGYIYPKKEEHEVLCEFSKYQTLMHDRLLFRELGKSKKKQQNSQLVGSTSKPTDMSDEQSELNPGSSYRMGSRQACNFVFPASIPRPLKNVRADALWEKFLESSIEFEFLVEKDETVAVEGKKDRIRKIHVPPTTTEELKKIVTFIKNNKLAELDISMDIGEDADVIGIVDEEDDEFTLYKTYITRKLIEQANENRADKVLPTKIPSVRSDKKLAYYLSNNDIKKIKTYVGEFKDRVSGAIEQLIAGAPRYFTIKRLKEHYSIKMGLIYEHITGNIAAGACYTEKATKTPIHDTKEEEPSPNFPRTLPAGDGEEDENDEETVDEDTGNADVNQQLSSIKVQRIRDNDDPLLKHMDVFETQEKLDMAGLTVRGGPAIVYSFFNSAEGVGIFSKVLEAHGFEEYADTSHHVKFDKIERKPRYAFIRGGMKAQLKDNVIDVFSSKENVNGQLIRVVLVTQAAAQGISLLNVRQIHVMEPYWDNVMIEQVIGRGFRLKALQHVPRPEDRVINVFKYLATRATGLPSDHYLQYNHKITETGPNSITTDQHIQEVADIKDAFRPAARELRSRIAIDCPNNSKYNTEAGTYNCFSFKNTSSGNAYNLDDKYDTEETVQKLVGKEEIKVDIFSYGGKYYFMFNENVEISLQPLSAQNAARRWTPFGPAEIARVPPVNWKAPENWDHKTPLKLSSEFLLDKTSLPIAGYVMKTAKSVKIIMADTKDFGIKIRRN